MSLFPVSGFARMQRRCAIAAVCVLLGAASLAQANINDDFNRADSDSIGNGWIEKSAPAFRIVSNQVAKQPSNTGYLNNIVYRPAAENVADVEVSLEMRLVGSSPGYAQIFARVDTATAATPGVLDGYILYVNDSNSQLILGRQRGSAFVTTLAELTLTTPFNTTDRFRMRLRVTGSNPVLVEAFVDRFTGSDWALIGQASAADASASRLTGAGSVGFGGYTEGSYTFDNFQRTNLTSSANPTPLIASLSPNTVQAGESGLILTVTGSNFVNGASVRWNGSNRTTTFVDSTTLEANIPPADLASAGSASITVFNPAPGGGVSNSQTFTVTAAPIDNPVPVVSTLAPATATAGSAGFTLTVTGSQFASTAAIRWNGVTRPTTFVSASELRTAVSAADIATAGTASITVVNPAPGGGTSAALTFTINPAPPPNPAPSATSLSPTSVNAGAAGFSLTVNGSGFVNGSVIRWNGSNRPTTLVSATQLTAAITAADVAIAGTATVTVFNPAPGGGTSSGLTFTINALSGGGGHRLTSLSPLSVATGTGGATLTVTGAGFTSSSIVRFNGSNRTTTYVSATELRAALTSADLAVAGNAAITVSTVGSGTTAPLTFFILDGGQSIFFDGFNRADSPSLGNGWTEKYGPAFAISNNTVSSVYTYPQDYHDTIVYRTSSTEDQLDVETSVEFVRTAGAEFPQLHARAQRSTIGGADTLHSYIFYVEDNYAAPGGVAIAIQPPIQDTGECLMTFIPFPSALQVGQRYRLRFIVQGSYPVQLTGIVERFDGNRWLTHASGSITHDNNLQRDPALYCPHPAMPAPITTAGAVGFAKWWTQTDDYDNFFWRGLGSGGSSNLPSLTGIAPNSATAGSDPLTLEVNGTNFNANSVVRWNGANRVTTYVSPTTLRAAIPAADLATVGSATITVFNPGAGGGTTAQSGTFLILPPAGSATFRDEFSRADSSVLGNGWIEKTPAAFFLQSGEASKQSVTSGYRDNVVFRPASENLVNAEVSAIMRLRSASIGYPQLFTRIQTSTALLSGSVTGYMLYFDGSPSTAIIGRQIESGFVSTLAYVAVSPALNTNDTYRLRLSARGTNPVQLEAFVERLNGTTWQVIGQATATDAAANRITSAGSQGFGGYTENSYAFDVFEVRDLGP